MLYALFVGILLTATLLLSSSCSGGRVGCRRPRPTCYEPPPATRSLIYTCPACGNRSTYPFHIGTEPEAPSAAWAVKTGVFEARRLVQKLDDENVALDESSFCRTCSPDVVAPQLALVIKGAEGTTRSFAGAVLADLQLLIKQKTGDVALTTEEEARVKELLGLESRNSDE